MTKVHPTAVAVTDEPPRSEAARKNTGRLESLDLLRLVAALSVVFFHYAFRGAAADGFTTVSVPAWAPLAKYGYLGVNLFFMISGFVIVWSAEGRTAVSFAIARAARIYPGFLACMSITWLVCWAFGGPRFAVTIHQWVANLLIAAPIVRQPFMDGAYWSIVYELTFYGWVAILLGGGIFWRRFDAIVAAWLAISLINLHIVHSGAIERVFLTSSSGFFATGMMLYSIHTGRTGVWIRLLATAAILVSIDQALIDAEWLRSHYQQAWSSAAIALIILACASLVAVAIRLKRMPLPSGLVLALGGLTYPLYLLHQHIGYIVLNKLRGVASPSILVLATAGVMIVAAFAVWRFIERPTIPMCRRRLTQIAKRVAETLSEPLFLDILERLRRSTLRSGSG